MVLRILGSDGMAEMKNITGSGRDDNRRDAGRCVNVATQIECEKKNPPTAAQFSSGFSVRVTDAARWTDLSVIHFVLDIQDVRTYTN